MTTLEDDGIIASGERPGRRALARRPAAEIPIMGNLDRPELAEALSDSFCRSDPEIAKAFARVTFLSDLRAEVPKLQTPTLILQTQEDVIAPVEVGRYMHAKLPDSEFVLMEASGHCPHMNAPGETVSAIQRHLTR